jgi:hypothetical protein
MQDTPKVNADAARASVTPHTIHLELAQSQAEGVFTPVLHLAVSIDVAAELAELLAHSVTRARELQGGG